MTISTELSTKSFVKEHLPSVYKLVKLGQYGTLFKLIEKSFCLLTELQLCGIPLQNRNICVRHYLDAETKSKMPQMQRLYSEWLESEAEYIEEAIGKEHVLTEKEKKLIPLVRQSIFTTLYEEQEALKSQDAFHPFLSICSEDGRQNERYYEYVLKVEQARGDKKQLAEEKKSPRSIGIC